jgi:lysophospholipase L1-like esterase
MSPRITLLASLCLLASGPLRSAPADSFFLHDHDRVVFYGDSITQDGGYGLLVEEYARTRYPALDLRFYNAGVGGDRVDGGAAGPRDLRVERDAVRLHPTVVTIMLGMNDGSYRPFDPAIQEHFAAGYRTIVDTLRKELPGVRIFLIIPSPFDDVSRPPQFPSGYDSVLRRLGETVTAIAAEDHLDTVDFGGPLNSGIAAVLGHNPELARTLLPDRVHPSRAGHMVLGAALLRAWHATSLVSRVRINASSGTVEESANTEVRGLHSEAQRWSWVQADRSLPLPVNYDDASVSLAAAAGAGLEALDDETLQVTGLAAGRYELRIDDSVVGTFPADELGRGVNLALLNTPMRGQAYSVVWGAEGGHDLQLVRRTLLAHPKNPEGAAAADTLGARDEADQAERSRAAVPPARTYSLALLP